MSRVLQWPPRRVFRWTEAPYYENAKHHVWLQCRGYAGAARMGPRLSFTLVDEYRGRVRRFSWEFGTADAKRLVLGALNFLPGSTANAHARSYAREWLRYVKRRR